MRVSQKKIYYEREFQTTSFRSLMDKSKAGSAHSSWTAKYQLQVMRDEIRIAVEI